MVQSRMTFGELVESARNLGFELYDAREMPVDVELQPSFEDANLTVAPATLQLLPDPPEGERGMVATLRVREHVFYLWGEHSRAWELEQLAAGAERPPRSLPLGEPPELE